MLLIPLLRCGQPAEPAGEAWSTAVGFIEAGGVEPGPLVVPDTVQAGAPFEITISTFGSSGCIRPDDSEVRQSGALVDVTPYDSVWAGSVPCLPDWRRYPRGIELRFDAPGSGLIRLHGRGFDRDITVQRTVVVRP